MEQLSEVIVGKISSSFGTALRRLFKLSEQSEPKSLVIEAYWPPSHGDVSFLAYESDADTELPWDYHIKNFHRLAGVPRDYESWTARHFANFKTALRQVWKPLQKALPKGSKLYLMVHDSIEMFDLGSGKTVPRPMDDSDTLINPKPEDPKARKKRIQKTGQMGKLPLGSSIEEVKSFFNSTKPPRLHEGNHNVLELILIPCGFEGYFTENALMRADYSSPYSFEVLGVRIGDTKDKVSKILGAPDRIDTHWNFRQGKKVVRESWKYQGMGFVFFDRKGFVVVIVECEGGLLI